MLAQKPQKPVTILFIAVSLVLMLLSESALAARQAKSKGSAQQSKQAKEDSSASQKQQPKAPAARSGNTAVPKKSVSRPQAVKPQISRPTRPAATTTKRTVATHSKATINTNTRTQTVVNKPAATTQNTRSRVGTTIKTQPKAAASSQTSTSTKPQATTKVKSTVGTRTQSQTVVSKPAATTQSTRSSRTVSSGNKNQSSASTNRTVVSSNTNQRKSSVSSRQRGTSSSTTIGRQAQSDKRMNKNRPTTTTVTTSPASSRTTVISSTSRPARSTRVAKPQRTNVVNNINVVAESRRPAQINQGGSRRRFSGRIKNSKVIYSNNRRVVQHVGGRGGSRHNRFRYNYRHAHVYRNSFNQICHRIVRPKYCFGVYYNLGSLFTFRYVYPYYHRKYVFVSLGGYWPVGYSYVRYYQYGYHPYWWYGYEPVAREVVSDTHNYYTYNYNYYGSGGGTYDSAEIDENTFADVRERLAQQRGEEPADETLADVYFDEAVKAFEANDFDVAVDKLAQAVRFAPEDVILPFAYSQALLANEQYIEAAAILRQGLENVTAEAEGVFYPRGLYANDEILFEQINRLIERVDEYPFDGDLQLLLGYQLMGIGEIDAASEPLEQARLDQINAEPATKLLDLLEKIAIENAKEDNED